MPGKGGQPVGGEVPAVGVVGGGFLHDDNDNDNDNTYMTPLGRLDLQSRSA